MTRSFKVIDIDRERRARGIVQARWDAAPAAPATRGDCEDGPRPCPHLRCVYHLGERGDRKFSCELDFTEHAPRDEFGLVTYEAIGAALGVSQERVVKDYVTARDKLRVIDDAEVLKRLGIRKRHA